MEMPPKAMEWPCASSLCVCLILTAVPSLRCDGRIDCQDGEDERDCKVDSNLNLHNSQFSTHTPQKSNRSRYNPTLFSVLTFSTTVAMAIVLKNGGGRSIFASPPLLLLLFGSLLLSFAFKLDQICDQPPHVGVFMFLVVFLFVFVCTYFDHQMCDRRPDCNVCAFCIWVLGVGWLSANRILQPFQRACI